MARTEESQRREADRKEGWNARRWYEGIMAKQKTHMGGAVTETELLIANIDRSVTQEVRSVLDQATVDLYAETEDEWSATAPVDVWWDGAKACYASDGGHRIAAKEKNGRKKILCRVHRCDDAESALTLARLHAFGPANHAHGRARTPEDKRKTVRSCIALPEYAGESDRRIAEICKVGKWLVGQVRAEIAGAPKPAPRTVKADSPPKPAPTPASGRATTAEERVIESLTKPGVVEKLVERLESEDIVESPEVVARPPAKEHKALTDARGRVVPEPMVSLFRLGRAFAADLRGVLHEAADGVKSAAEESWGIGLAQMVPTLEADLKKVAQDAAASLPWCCCPHVDQATGEHLVEGKCRVCINNRGWLTRHNWHQLGDPIKQLIDEHAEPDAEREDA